MDESLISFIRGSSSTQVEAHPEIPAKDLLTPSDDGEVRDTTVEATKMMLEVLIQGKAKELLDSHLTSEETIFKPMVVKKFNPKQIKGSPLLQFAMWSPAAWYKHVKLLIKNVQSAPAKKWTAQQWKDKIYAGLAPFTPDHSFGNDLQLLLMACYVKQFINAHLCYGFVDASVITALAKFIGSSSCLEVGAGNGLWARLLACEGVSITATDLFNEHLQVHGAQQTGTFYPVSKASAEEAVTQFPTDCLLLVWPREYHFPSNFTGSKVIYVGELGDGCTSGHPPPEHWIQVSVVEVPSFPFMLDDAYLYIRSDAK